MNEGSIEPSWPVDSTHSGKCDKPATGRGEKEGSVGGRSHHQHYHLTQLCLYLTDNQGDFRAQGGGWGDNTGVTSPAPVAVRSHHKLISDLICQICSQKKPSQATIQDRAVTGLWLWWQGVEELWTVLKQARLHLPCLRPLQSNSSVVRDRRDILTGGIRQ